MFMLINSNSEGLRMSSFFMIADLDPVIVIELGTKESIHRCIGCFVQPAIHRSIPSVQQGMNMFNIICHRI